MPGRRILLAVVAAATPLATACAPEVRAFDLIAPAEAIELVPVPGQATTFRWTYDADGAEEVIVNIEAVPTIGVVQHPRIAWSSLASSVATYVVPPGAALVEEPSPVLPAGVYRITGHALDDDGDELARSTAPGLLVMQGVAFRETALAFTSDVNARDIWMTTVTASVTRVVVYLASTADGPRLVISDGTIASDLAPVGRVITFTGRTIDDVAIPAGPYRAFAEVRANGGTLPYTVAGPTISWEPDL